MIGTRINAECAPPCTSATPDFWRGQPMPRYPAPPPSPFPPFPLHPIASHAMSSRRRKIQSNVSRSQDQEKKKVVSSNNHTFHGAPFAPPPWTHARIPRFRRATRPFGQGPPAKAPSAAGGSNQKKKIRRTESSRARQGRRTGSYYEVKKGRPGGTDGMPVSLPPWKWWWWCLGFFFDFALLESLRAEGGGEASVCMWHTDLGTTTTVTATTTIVTTTATYLH